MINCPNKSSQAFKSLEEKVGTTLAYSIWNKTEGNIDNLGLPMNGYWQGKLSAEELSAIHEARFNEARRLGNPTDQFVRRDIFDGRNDSTVGEVLDRINIRNPGLSPIINALRNVISLGDYNIRIDLEPVNYLENSMGNITLAEYNSGLHSIRISEFGDYSQTSPNGLSHNAIIHEIIHSISARYINNNPQSTHVEKLRDIYNHVLSNIQEKYNITEAEAKGKYYGLKNLNEFISEGFTNSKFIKELSSISSPQIGEKNIFQDFLDWVSKILKIPSSAYNDFVSVASSLLDHSAKSVDEVQGGARPEASIFAIKVPSDEKNIDRDFIIKTSDNQAITSEEKHAGIGVIKDAFSTLIRKEGNNVSVRRMLNVAYNSLKSHYNRQAELSEDDSISEDERDIAYNNALSVRKILDITAWKRIVDSTIKELRGLGIDVSEDVINSISNEDRLREMSEDEIESESEDDEMINTSDTDYLSGEDWNNDGMFSRSESSTSSDSVKILMWSLKDPSENALGLARHMDTERAYQKVLALTSMTADRSVDGILRAIEDEASILDKFIPNNMFRQLSDNLKEGDAQLRIQFAIAMNRHRNMFIMNSWNTKYSTLSTYNSERRRADRVVFNEWKSMISGVLYNNPKERKNIFDSFSKSISDAREYRKKNISLIGPKLDAELVEFVKEAFASLGIRLSNKTYDELRLPKTYNKRKGYTFSGKSLDSQFGYSETGNPIGIFSAIEQTLSGKGENGIADNDSPDVILRKLDQSAFKFLANIEAGHKNGYFANMSTGVDGNAHYNFGINTYQTNMLHDLINDKVEENGIKRFPLIEALRNSIFTGEASWLKNKNLGRDNTPFRNSWRIGYKDGIRKDGTKKASTRKLMAQSEAVLSLISDFQNNGKDTMFVWDTTKADKHLTSVFELPRTSLPKGIVIPGQKGNMASINKDVLMKSDALDDAFCIVRGELGRILAIITTDSNGRERLRNEYSAHYVDNGQFIYSYKFLNKIFKRDASNNIVPNQKIDVNGKQVSAIKLMSLENPEYENFFKDKLADYFIKKAEDDIELLKKNGLVEVDGQLIKDIPVNQSYALNNKLGYFAPNQWGGTEFVFKNKKQALLHLLLDLNLNSQVAVHNSMMLISGDPAEINKSVKGFIAKHLNRGEQTLDFAIDDAMAEYQKRLASDNAPGISVAKGVVLKSGKRLPDTYSAVFVNDMKTNGDEYKKSLAKELNVDIKDLSTVGSDALEFVSLDHKLDLLFKYGQLLENEYTHLKSKYNSGRDLDESDLRKIIIGAGKPRQVTHRFVDIDGVLYFKKIYVKSAEMPLIRQITETMNGPLNDLRQVMEDEKIDRLVHVSAAKVGAENIMTIYDDKGNFLPKDELVKSFSRGRTNMEFAGFGYQQDLPYDESHDKIRLVTQADTSILEGLLDKEFKYKGEKVNGNDLLERKHSIRIALSQAEERDVDSELGYNDGLFNEDKAVSVMSSEASRIGVMENNVKHVQNAAKAKIPLLFSAVASKLENILFSMYSNRVIKPKQPGGSFVQFPDLGRGIDTLDADKINNINGLIKTKWYNAETGLKYMSSTKDGISYMDILLPFKAWNEMNKLANIKDFVDDKTNLIDLSKFGENEKEAEKLLTIIGMRIPNQGHSSQVIGRIVGFLPKSYGDVAIVPPEITTQMGSDFDIDKLYTYWRNTFLTKDGKLSSIPSNAISFDENNDIIINHDVINSWWLSRVKNDERLLKKIDRAREIDEKVARSLSKATDTGESSDIADLMNTMLSDQEYGELLVKDMETPDSLIKKALQDSYFEIFESVLSDKDVIKKALSPLEKPDLLEEASLVIANNPKGEFGDYVRQISDYMLQSGSKSGVAIFSKIISAAIKMENKNIAIMVKDPESGKVKNYVFAKFKNNKDKVLKLGRLNPNNKNTYIDINGKPHERSGIENIRTQQSGAVDNANKPVLAKNNLNVQTFNVSALMSILSDSSGNGLSLSTNARFLRQEGIKMLTDHLVESNGTIAKFKKGAEGDTRIATAAKEIINELRNRYSGDKSELDAYVDSLKSEAYSPNDFREVELTPPDQRNSKEYLGKQIDFINMFIELSDKAWPFSDATNVATIDSRGLGTNYHQNAGTIYRASKGMQSGDLANLSTLWSRNGSAFIELKNGKYLWKIDDNDKITASGHNISIALKVQNAIGKLMGYNNPMLIQATSDIERTKGSMFKSKRTFNAQRNIANEFKSFVFSKMPLLDGVTFENLVDNHQLANDLIRLKKERALSNNLFIQTLQSDEQLRFVTMEARISDSSAAENLTLGFYELATSDNPEYRKFAEDMVKYEYLMGGLQKMTSSLKYMDADILDKMGVNDQVSMLLKGDDISVDRSAEFVEKYFQNNPEEASIISKINRKLFKDKESKESYVRINVDTSSKSFDNVDREFLGRIITIDDSGEPSYKNYISSYVGGDIKLYKFNPEALVDGFARYDEIPTRGSASINRRGTPSFSDYSGSYGERVTPKLLKDIRPLGSETAVDSGFSSDQLMSDIPHNSYVKDLKSFFSNSENTNVAWSGALAESMGDYMNNVKMVYEPNDPEGRVAVYELEKRQICIYKKQMSEVIDKYGIEYAHETIAHELNHAMMAEAYSLGKNGNKTFKKISDTVDALYRDAANSMDNVPVISIVTGKTLNADWTYILTAISHDEHIDSIAQHFYPDDTDSRNELKLTMYSFNSPEEFVANLMSRPKFQTQMKQVQISPETAKKIGITKGKNVLRAFLESFAKLFTKLNSITFKNENGQKSSKNSVYEAAFINMMTLVDKVKEIPQRKDVSVPVVSIPQNLVSGKLSFGTIQVANSESKKLLGPNPHSIDMIEAGLRTRTTRSVGEMQKYNIRVGDIITQSGISADGTIKKVQTKITAIYPKGTPEYLSTWYKEGWTQEGIDNIKRFKDGAAAIEFEVLKPMETTTKPMSHSEQLEFEMKWKESNVALPRAKKIPKKMTELPKLEDFQGDEASYFRSLEQFRRDNPDKASIGIEFQKPQILVEPNFRTLDLKDLVGTKQSKEAVAMVDDIIINNPDMPIANGESFTNFSTNVLSALNKLIESAPDNAVIITHNSAFGLMRLWNTLGRPQNLDNNFRTRYTKMESSPGDTFQIKSRNGIINIVRHGETEDNVSGNFRSEQTRLTQNGINKAKELGKKLSNASVIITSDVPRTLHTANIIANGGTMAQLGSTVVEYLRNSEKNVRFAFRDAVERGIFKTKCE
jgi:broad specificity phosphatase PhoE